MVPCDANREGVAILFWLVTFIYKAKSTQVSHTHFKRIEFYLLTLFKFHIFWYFDAWWGKTTQYSTKKANIRKVSKNIFFLFPNLFIIFWVPNPSHDIEYIVCIQYIYVCRPFGEVEEAEHHAHHRPGPAETIPSFLPGLPWQRTSLT